MRIPLGYRPIDPKRRTNFIDSCAFDPKYFPEDRASIRIFSLYESQKIVLNIAHSNLKEIDHPHTPEWVKRKSTGLIYSIKTNLTNQENKVKEKILEILTGNGKPNNMIKDAEHIFEASKYCGYFITVDDRILKRKEALAAICSATIVKPSEFLKIYDSYPEI